MSVQSNSGLCIPLAIVMTTALIVQRQPPCLVEARAVKGAFPEGFLSTVKKEREVSLNVRFLWKAEWEFLGGWGGQFKMKKQQQRLPSRAAGGGIGNASVGEVGLRPV